MQHKGLRVYMMFSLAMSTFFRPIVKNDVPQPTGRETYWFWCRSCWRSHLRWSQRRPDTSLSAQYLVSQWLDSRIYHWDITKNQLDFDDLDLHVIFKVTAVDRLKIHGWRTSVFSENSGIRCTVELQWLEPRWLVYHGWVEHVLESSGISSKYDTPII